MKDSIHIPFTKFQATGNDFVLVDSRSGILENIDLSDLAPKICDRKFGVGSDGIITLGENNAGELVMGYKNPDGSDAGMCGNGARCFAMFARELGYGDRNDAVGSRLKFRVHENLYEAGIDGDQIRIRFPLETQAKPVDLNGKSLLQVYTNTEHVVCPVEATMLKQTDTLIEKGRTLRYHDFFAPEGTNVNFLSGSGEDQIDLQTYERGVENLTLACGTGAIASALAWHHIQQKPAGEFQYKVHTQGGTLTIHFTFVEATKTYTNISLEGPAKIVFEGTFYL